MKKSMLFLSLMLSAPYIMANELSSCPNKSEINYQQGVIQHLMVNGSGRLLVWKIAEMYDISYM